MKLFQGSTHCFEIELYVKQSALKNYGPNDARWKLEDAVMEEYLDFCPYKENTNGGSILRGREFGTLILNFEI